MKIRARRGYRGEPELVNQLSLPLCSSRRSTNQTRALKTGLFLLIQMEREEGGGRGAEKGKKEGGGCRRRRRCLHGCCCRSNPSPAGRRGM